MQTEEDNQGRLWQVDLIKKLSAIKNRPILVGGQEAFCLKEIYLLLKVTGFAITSTDKDLTKLQDLGYDIISRN